MSKKLTLAQAINLALKQEMEEDDKVIVLGEDVGVNGGVFRVTEGLIDQFGEKRVLDTPVAEAGIAGLSIGLAIQGHKPVCEMQFSGFSYLGFHQLEAHASRMRWRSRGRFHVPMVMRAPYGGGIRALEHHSESRETYYAHTPGLKTVIPSGPRNARALLLSAIRDPDPVVFYEPKAIYRAFKEEVPDEPETMPIGKAKVVTEGDAVTLISYGAMLQRAIAAAERMENEEGAKAEVIDLRTISPLDGKTIGKSVEKTGRAVIVNEAPRSFGPASEITARIIEEAFLHLRAPIQRVTGYDTHMPYFAREQLYLPSEERIFEALRESVQF